MKNTFGATNNGHTPVISILFCAAFSLLALLGLCDPTFNQVSGSAKKDAQLSHAID